ncbi:MAG: phosphate signaling complex protein PhoU [Candidatus Kapabacteria bacterium]|nr:phosphate signaling complex protein PhoU [Candidatus Kapabacteria bacterium]
MGEHLLKQFDDEMNKLRFRLVRVGTLLQQQIELAISSLLDNNYERANLVIELEKKIDQLDIKIDKQCARIIALHQPVAQDLRLILAGFQINIYMEMMSDLATNITKRVLEMPDIQSIVAQTNINKMAKRLEEMISDILDGFVNMNVELAIKAVKASEDIDSIFDDNFKLINSIMIDDHSLIKFCANLQDINRNFQIIAKQGKSIAQELVFLFEAKVVKHFNIEDLNEIEKQEL